jgi:hypothetical protein
MNGDDWIGWATQMTRAMNALTKKQADVLAAVKALAFLVQKEDTDIMVTQQTLTDLESTVTNLGTVVGSATAAFHGIADILKQAIDSGDDQAVEAQIQKLHEQADSLAAAVATVPAATGAGTAPAATSPVETPPVEQPPAEPTSTTESEEAPTEHAAHRSGHKRR